jgi:hypothetical protein
MVFVKKWGDVSILAVFVCVTLFLMADHSCKTIEPRPPVMSSHGWSVWFSRVMQSFDTRGERVCVPEGFEPIGAERTGMGWAVFSPKASGVFVRSSDFESRYIMAAHGSYILRIMHLKDIPKEDVDAYVSMITRAFDDISTLYPNTLSGAVSYHTVLITVGIAGAGDTFETSVYPNPSVHTSILVHNLTDARTEELYIHAVAHLYNRFREDLTAYHAYQAPFPAEDWEELEAAWSEIVFRSTNEDRADRLDELYRVHTAVLSTTFNANTPYPFNERELFDAVKQKGAILDANAQYSDYQYGHYILGPLVMTAIDGLLQESNTGTDLATILKHIHGDPTTNIMEVLSSKLSFQDIKDITQWAIGEKEIPKHLIESALDFYNAQNI